MDVGPIIILAQRYKQDNTVPQKQNFYVSLIIIKVIIGAHYDTSADVWSFACTIFEMLTGDFLFEPRDGPKFSKDDDHLAQI